MLVSMHCNSVSLFLCLQKLVFLCVDVTNYFNLFSRLRYFYMIRTLNIVGTDEKISYLGRIFKKFTAIRSLLIDQLCLWYDIALSIIHLK